MVSVSTFAHDFAGWRDAYALLSTLVGFEFWHFVPFPTLVNILNALGCREPVGVLGNLLMANHEDKVASAHLRFAVNYDVRTKLFDDFVHQFGADFFVGDFATTEDNHNFDSVATFE